MTGADYQSDEKVTVLSQSLEPGEPTKAGQRRAHQRKCWVIVGFLLIWWSYYSVHSPVGFGRDRGSVLPEDETKELLDFDTIVPSEKLEWHPCINNRLCARLTVPMDYHRPLNRSKCNPKVHIGLVLVPGIHTGTEKVSKSPLLINPGGPGGSGTEFAILFGRSLQQIIGEDRDIIGFDPRGVHTTTPRADCFSFPDNPGLRPPTYDDENFVRGDYHRFLWEQISGREIGIVNSSSVALQKLDLRARGMAELCQRKDKLYGEDSILKYVNTPNVARDMLSIIDAWDEWASTQNNATADLAATVEGMEDNPQSPTDESHSSDQDTKGKLVYWGFSYGTLLSATFASLFPDRVGRMVLDGVVDADHYVGPLWAESLWDADKVWDSFSKYCHEAAGDCDLYREGDKVKDIENRLQQVVTRFQKQPLTWVDELVKMPRSVTNSDLRLLLFQSLYAPTQIFPILASIFNRVHEGYDDIIKYIFSNLFDLDACIFCESSLRRFNIRDEAFLAIMCSDKRYRLNETVANLQKRFEEMASISSWSDVWMTAMIGCDAYGIETKDPPMRWDDNPAHELKPINTSFPLLFISNTADPVTPLHAGLKMAKKFVDAGLIEQKSEGHCSIAAVSKCTIGKIRAYIAQGKLPPHPIEGGKGKELKDGKWDRCEADEWPFHPLSSHGVQYETQRENSMEDMEILNALKDLQEGFSKMKFWGNSGLEWVPVAQNFLAGL